MTTGLARAGQVQCVQRHQLPLLTVFRTNNQEGNNNSNRINQDSSRINSNKINSFNKISQDSSRINNNSNNNNPSFNKDLNLKLGPNPNLKLGLNLNLNPNLNLNLFQLSNNQILLIPTELKPKVCLIKSKPESTERKS